MTNKLVPSLTLMQAHKVFLRVAMCGLAIVLIAAPPTPAWQAEKREFVVASVRQSKPDEQSYTNFPLGPGPEYISGGHLAARNMPLSKFIEFAYKPSNYQVQLLRSEMPSWTRDIGFDDLVGLFVQGAAGVPIGEEQQRRHRKGEQQHIDKNNAKRLGL